MGKITEEIDRYDRLIEIAETERKGQSPSPDADFEGAENEMKSQQEKIAEKSRAKLEKLRNYQNQYSQDKANKEKEMRKAKAWEIVTSKANDDEKNKEARERMETLESEMKDCDDYLNTIYPIVMKIETVLKRVTK